MSELSVYQHLSVEQMKTLFGIQEEMKGLLIAPISICLANRAVQVHTQEMKGFCQHAPNFKGVM